MKEQLEFAELLKTFLTNQDIKDAHGVYLDEDTPHVDEIRSGADRVLITPMGTPNYTVMSALIKTLRPHGLIDIGPGETDSFGWVTGVIKTCKGNIVY